MPAGGHVRTHPAANAAHSYVSWTLTTLSNYPKPPRIKADRQIKRPDQGFDLSFNNGSTGSQFLRAASWLALLAFLLINDAFQTFISEIRLQVGPSHRGRSLCGRIGRQDEPAAPMTADFYRNFSFNRHSTMCNDTHRHVGSLEEGDSLPATRIYSRVFTINPGGETSTVRTRVPAQAISAKIKNNINGTKQEIIQLLH